MTERITNQSRQTETTRTRTRNAYSEAKPRLTLTDRQILKGGGALVIGALAATLLGGVKLPSPDFALGASTYSPNPAETATPTTGSASASPEASANPSSSPSEAPYKIIKQDPIPYGETVTLPANTVIVGDIFEINGQPWADSDSQTGLITILDQQAGVTTNPNFGAYYTTVENAQQAQALADADKPVTETLGCIPGQGCKIVDELHYPGTSQYALSLQQAGIPTPSVSPTESQQPVQPQSIETPNGQAFTLGNGEEIIINVGCGCVVPVVKPCPTASATPTPTPSEGNCLRGFDIPYAMPPKPSEGATFTTDPTRDYIIQGDVSVNGTPEYGVGGNGKANITVIEDKKVNVRMDFGGDVHEVASCTSTSEFTSLVQMYESQQLKANPSFTGVTEHVIN